MPEPNIYTANKQHHLLYTLILFGSQRELLMEHKYFDVIDDFRHPQCMMECSWWPKRKPCSLFRTKKDQTHLQEFFISLMQPFRGCLAELHHLFSMCDCQTCHKKPLYMMLSGHYLARFAGTSRTWQNKALQWTQIRS